MSFSIISPPNSFVDFNPPAALTCLEQPDISLPAYNDFAIQFQFQVLGDLPADGILKAVIADAAGQKIIDQNVLAENLCYQYRLSADESKFPVTIGAGQPLPAGTYDYPTFLAALGSLLGLTIPSSQFDYCCLFPTEPVVTSAGTITFQAFWDFGFVSFPATKMAGLIAIGECFRYGIADSDGNILAVSNKFRRVADTCFTTLIAYWNDDDAFGFSYPTPAFYNTVRLPCSFRKPVYPVVEQVYTKSNGKMRRASARVSKEYEGYTDVLTDYFHDRIVMAFKHDHIQFTNTDVGLVAAELFVEGDYKPDWPDENTVLVAPAKFKIAVPMSNINSNCYSQATTPCCPPFPISVAITDISFSVIVKFGVLTSSWNFRYRITGTNIWTTVSNISSTRVDINNLPSGAQFEYQLQSNCGAVTGGWSPSYYIYTTGTPVISCDGTVSNIRFNQTGPGGGVLSWDPAGSAIQWQVSIDNRPAQTVSSPSLSTTLFSLAVGDHTVTITPLCDGGATGTPSTGSFNVSQGPTLTLSQQGTTSSGTTQQTFIVGNSVAAGNKFTLVVYSHEVTIVAVAGDTPAIIAAELASAINATTPGQWNSAGSAPPSGTPGFPPLAASFGNRITLIVDGGHSFGGGATFN